ncbi:MAG: PAS domain S-box protein [Polyangiaceae bacterium]
MTDPPPADRPSEPSSPASLALLRFFSSMDRVNRAIQGAGDLDTLLADVLDVTLSVLACDRAWLVCPADPAAPTWRVTMERTRPEYPGGAPLNVDLPMVPGVRFIIETALAEPGPVAFGPSHPLQLPAFFRDSFGVLAGVGMAIHPEGAPPYLFGLHQCSYERTWSADDLRIFEGIARRLTDALTSLLALRRLRESQSRYRGFMDHASDAFFLLDEKGVIQDVNRRASELLGYAREELIGRTPVLFDLGLTPELLAANGRRVLGGSRLSIDSTVRRKDGTTFPVDVRIGRMDFRGHFWRVAVVRDVTERNRAAAAAERGEQRLRAFFESSNVGMVQIGPTGAVERANDGFCTMTGYPREELTGMVISELVFDEDLPALRRTWGEMIRGVRERFAGEQRYRRKDGSASFSLTHVVVNSRDAAGLPKEMAAVVVELTERKRLEEHLRRARKMEAIGQLAGGVAHDFNNLLTVINGYGEFLYSSLPTADSRRDAAAAVREAGERAARLTSQLLSFSRKAIVEPKILDLSTIVESTNKMLSRLIGEDVSVVTRLSARLPSVRADAGQLEQVLLNLAVNARDAMPKGGKLTIATDEIDLPPGSTWDGEDIPAGRYVRLRVSDTGTGMSEEVRARIFEPFFTTKGTGQGTGLGLAAVYGIVRQAGGSVAVESLEGQGTTFTVLLPALSSGTAGEDVRPSVRGAETVLLVESDTAIRKLARRILERSGYTVIDATRGIEALRMAEQHAGPIHLLIAEMGAPGLSGTTLFEALRSRCTGVRALYIGSATDEAAAQKAGGANVPVLQKPFSPAALTRRAREVLDEPAASRSYVPGGDPR